MDLTGRPNPRLTLRAGLPVVRRDDRHLQIGVDEPDRVVLPDRPGLYDALRAPGGRWPEGLVPTRNRLEADGWLVDQSALDSRRRADAARRPPVALDSTPPWPDVLVRTAAAAGVVVSPGAGLRVVAGPGEPRRATSDRLVRDDVVHVWVAAFPDRVRIGPLVAPGRSACLRCVDAHLGDRDVRRATVLHQVEQLPPPVFRADPSLLQLAAAWVIRDVVRALDGARPSLFSATVTVTADLEVVRREWSRHPHCGCAWDSVDHEPPHTLDTGHVAGEVTP
jgi:bacteriocin biosynthesis cyclodehydratase domain-containing protein